MCLSVSLSVGFAADLAVNQPTPGDAPAFLFLSALLATVYQPTRVAPFVERRRRATAPSRHRRSCASVQPRVSEFLVSADPWVIVSCCVRGNERIHPQTIRNDYRHGRLAEGPYALDQSDRSPAKSSSATRFRAPSAAISMLIRFGSSKKTSDTARSRIIDATVRRSCSNELSSLSMNGDST